MANKKTLHPVFHKNDSLKINSQRLLKLTPVLIIILFTACSSSKNDREETIQTVKIKEALDAKQNVLLSEIIDGNIEYVPLETNENSLIDNNPRFYLNKNEIIVFTKQKVSVFDRETGKFLREIGHYGRDPEGYQGTKYSFPYDEKNDLYYLSGQGQQVYFRYNSSGKLVDEITAYSDTKEPDIENSEFGEMINAVAPLNDTCFVGSVWNINGRQKTKLIIFNENNHRIKTYPQTKSFEYNIFTNGMNVYSWEGWFYPFKDQLRFFERFSDTIYTVTMDELRPTFLLGNGNAGAPYTMRYKKEYNPDNYYLVENLFESEKFLFFKITYKKETYWGVYNKTEKSTKVSTNTDGIENDIDDIIPFQFYSADNNNEIIGSREAFEVKLWLEQNPEKAAKLPPHLQKLKDIKENDNPLVMIAKLKE